MARTKRASKNHSKPSIEQSDRVTRNCKRNIEDVISNSLDDTLEELLERENLYNRRYHTRGRIIISQETGTPTTEVIEAEGKVEDEGKEEGGEESPYEDSISTEDDEFDNSRSNKVEARPICFFSPSREAVKIDDSALNCHYDSLFEDLLPPGVIYIQ